MLEKVTRSVFSEALNTTFRVKIDGERPIDLSLIEASDLKQPGDLGRKDPFSLIFRGPADLVLPQQTYHMENDKVGKMEIFIVPVGTDDKGTLYQAVFS